MNRFSYSVKIGARLSGMYYTKEAAKKHAKEEGGIPIRIKNNKDGSCTVHPLKYIMLRPLS